MTEIFLAVDSLITSKTDLSGKIIYGNDDFTHFSGYSEKEFLYKPHNLIRHPDMPRIAFKLLWDTIQGGGEFFAFVKNLNRYNQTYWVFANITPSYDLNGKIVGYYSVRRCPSKEGVKVLDSVYKQLIEAEKQGGMESSYKLLKGILQEANMSYENLCISLQNQGKLSGWYGV